MINYRDVLHGIKGGSLIIGLTGYTASGCTTAARILMSRIHPTLPGVYHLDLDARPAEKIYHKLKRIWEDYRWSPFVRIEVSKVIFMIAVSNALASKSNRGDLAKIRKWARTYEQDFDGSELLTREGISMSRRAAQRLVHAYEKTAHLYIPFKKALRNELWQFTEMMQEFGDQIRKFGKIQPNGGEQPQPDKIVVLPEALRRLMKAYRKAHQESYFIVDAFRNPYEVEYFKRRYSEFYLVCIQRARRDRFAALQGFPPEAVDRLEKREKGTRVENRGKENISEWVTSQNIDECAQKADYFIDNPQSESRTYPNLHFQLIRLICLAKYPGCIPPDKDERSMQVAMTARQNSGCLSRHVGAVVSDTEGYILGVGWNDPPSGQVPCSLRTRRALLQEGSPEDFSAYERSAEFQTHIRNGGTGEIPFCFRAEYSSLLTDGGKVTEHTRALHAEENALLQATKHGSNALKGATLYTTDSPCTLCAKKAYHMGIRRVVYIEEYPGIATQQTLLSGDRNIAIDRFHGITGSAYFRLFSPLLYEKDSLVLYG